jgi:ribA/ribD-fused uncharacterized protein
VKIRNKEELLGFVESGNKVTYLFFWGHRKPKNGLTQSCLSQWYESGFEIDGITYPTAEHYMMAKKAKLFNDLDTHRKIIGASHPGQAKKYGRNVRGFDERTWGDQRFEIVVRGNLAKFSQNKPLGEFLLKTGNRILVEASPVDRVWGIGMAADNPDIENPGQWKGLNLLGFALMAVRDNL